MRGPTPSSADLKILDPEGRFRDRLEADRASIARLNKTGDLNGLERVVHGLAGAAGTFGYAEVGEIAIEIDEAFRGGRKPTALEVTRLLATLQQALSKPTKSG